MASYASQLCAITTTPKQEEEDQKLVYTAIPPQYHQHWKVFSKLASYQFPPAHEEDHAMTLKEGAPSAIDCKVYQQSEKELKAREEFIQDTVET